MIMNRLSAAFLLAALGLTSTTHAQIMAKNVVLKLIDEVDVPAQETGLLEQISVNEGDTVEASQVIARFDSRDVELLHSQTEIQLKIAEAEAADQSKIREAEESLRVARAELDRADKSRQELGNSISDAEFDRLQLAVVKAESLLARTRIELQVAELTAQQKQKDLDYTQLQLDRRSIRSPLTGVVVKVYRRPGQWLEAGDKLARVIRLDTLRAEGFVDREHATNLLGAPVQVALKSPAGGTVAFSGRIGFVSPEIDTFNDEVRVWAEIDNRHGKLQPGTKATMIIKPGR